MRRAAAAFVAGLALVAGLTGCTPEETKDGVKGNNAPAEGGVYRKVVRPGKMCSVPGKIGYAKPGFKGQAYQCYKANGDTFYHWYPVAS